MGRFLLSEKRFCKLITVNCSLRSKMPKTKLQKKEIVTELTEKVGRAKSLIFADFKGLTMSQLSVIRGQLTDISAELIVTKNNLLRIALKDSHINIDEKSIDGPTATLLAYDDQITPIKVLTKGLKDIQIGKIKSGFLDGEILDEAKIQKLASLPSKDELRAKVVGSLGAPLYGIVGVLQANLRNLVYALDQIRVKKGGE
jgi:large subunit ribosomal protein L10